MRNFRRKQQGVTLVVALIMLVLLTLLVLTSANLGKASLETVGNMQQRNEAQAAAEEAIQQAISSPRFINTPTTVFANPCDGVDNRKCFDTNGDGVTDVKVDVAPPKCVTVRTIINNQLQLTKASGAINNDDLACANGENPEDFSFENPAANSRCAQTVWEIQANATDAVTQASVQVTQGVAARVDVDAVATSCP